MRWQTEATDTRSWEMYRTALPMLRLSSAKSLMISVCVMTSRALVGSSAISSAGECMIAMAISTRCACPTLICAGKRSRNSRSCGSPTLFRAPSIAAARLLLVPCAWAFHASASWVPIRNAGFKLESGLCRTKAISRPRMLRISRSDAASKSRPRNSRRPAALPPLQASSFRMANAMVLFPEPLSPTSPRISPRWIWKDTRLSVRGLLGKSTQRSTDNRGCSLAIAGPLHCEFEVLDVPVCLRPQNHGFCVFERWRNTGESVLVHQINERNLVSHDFLDSVERLLSRVVVHRRRLRSHEAVDLRFPWRCGRLLPRVPLVSFGGTQPDVHLLVGIKFNVDQAEQHRFIVEVLRDSLNQRWEIEGDYVHGDAHRTQVLLDHRCHPFPRAAAGVGDDRKLDRVAFAIVKFAGRQAEAVLAQKLQGCLLVEPYRLQVRVEPEFVGWRDWSNRRPRVTVVQDFAQVVAINRRGNCAPKIARGEPPQLVSRNRRRADLVEPHLLGVERRAGIMHHGRRRSGKPVEIIGIHGVDEVDFAAAESHQLDVAVGLDLQLYGADVRQLPARCIALPVIRVLAQINVRSGLVVGNIVRTEGSHLLLGRQRRDDCDLVEQPVEPSYRRWEADGDFAGREHRALDFAVP